MFEPDSPFQRWERRGNEGIGPGSGDDKGGMAVMIAALRAMHAAGTLKDADIEVVLTGDEEDNGNPIEVARRDLVAAGKRADVALDFEGLAEEGTARTSGSIARRSSGAWTLTVTARSGHSSGIFSASAGNGAIYELARIIDTFRRELPEDKLTFNVGLVGGGATAEARRGPDPRSRRPARPTSSRRPRSRAATCARSAASRSSGSRRRCRRSSPRPLAGATAKLEFDPDEYPPMAPTAGNRALLGKLNVVNRDMGLEPMGELDPLKRGAGDISFVAQDVDGLIGLGPASDGDHAPGETVDIASIWRQAKRAAILMTRLSREKR